MQNSVISIEHSEILELLSKYESLYKDSDDDELKSHAAKYICVICSKFIETSIKRLYIEYLEKVVQDETIKKFVKAKISEIQNAKGEKIMHLASNFKDEWKKEISDLLQSNDSITSIVNNKNKICHEGSSDITLIKIKSYHKSALEVLQLIEKQLLITN